jgi:hypothetical protein
MKQLIATCILFPLALAAAGSGDGPRHAANGSLLFPSDYREWVFLSSGLGMTYGPAATPGTPRFDNVFVNRSAYKAFLESGKWQDGAMFVLEIRSATSEGSINKGGHFQTGVSAIEVEVKEAGKWTFYAFGKGDVAEGKPFPTTERCYECHSTNGAVDNTFVQFYPTLLPIATAKGTVKTGK